jgi:hypothetical protein
MGYAVYNLRGNYGRKDSDAKKFEEAAMMVEEGLECMRELADEMEDRYSERRYGMRGGYGRRDHEGWDDMDEMYGMRRRRDSRGRYM